MMLKSLVLVVCLSLMSVVPVAVVAAADACPT